MMRAMLRSVLLLGSIPISISLAVAVASCGTSSSGSTGSSGDGDGGDAAAKCVEYTTTVDLKTPTVSFKTDVMPFLERSCMFSSCHGAGSSKGDLKMVKGDPTATRKSLVGVNAPQLPTMQLVQAGDPKNSYVMKKVDGDICLLKDKCIAPCGDTMPQGNDLLEVPERDTLRRWIAQGAAEN